MKTQFNPSPIPSVIADNLCTQLLTYQNAIFARPEAERMPTTLEINMQTKLISNILKIKKFNATDHIAKFMTTFCRFISKNDKEQAKTVAAMFADFIGGTMTEQQQQQPADTPVKTPRPEPGPLPEDALKTEIRPYTYGHFDQYKYLLEDYRSGNRDTTIRLGDKEYNKQCVEYNLLQFTLPEESRKFILDPGEYHRLIDHEQTIKQIERYLHIRAS